MNYFISGQNDCNYPPTPYSTQSSRAERNSNEPSPSPEDIQSSSLPKDNAPNADYGALVDKISQLQVFLNGILLPKLFWPTVRKNCSSDREKFLRSLELFIQAVKGQNNFGDRMLF